MSDASLTPTVLLVHPDDKVAADFSRALAPFEVTLRRVRDAQGALATLRRLGDDAVIVVNHELGGGTRGVELIEALRKRGTSLPMVFLSAFWVEMTLTDFDHLTDDLDVARIVNQPVSAGELLLNLSAARGGRAYQRRAREPGPPPVPRGAQRRPDSIRAPLARHRRTYAARVSQQLVELAETLRALATSPTREADHRRVLHGLHRIRGTSGTLGLLSLSEQLQEIEHQLRGAEPTVSRCQRLADALTASASAVRNRGSDPLTVVEGSDAVLRVLFADDDPDMCEQVVDFGRERLIDVRVAVDIASAKALVRELTFDAAFVDRHLADGQSGFELARELRDVAAGLPVFFVSSDDSVATRVDAAHAGGERFLVKPLERHEFFAACLEVIERRAASSPSVLVVDDDPMMLDLVRSVLTAEGMEVRTLGQPHHIMAALDERPADAIVLDLQMPGVSGLDVCRMLRTTTLWRSLPIVFMTVDARASTRLACYRAGADDCLIKPFDTEELVARLRVCLERRQLYERWATRDPLTGLLNRRAFMARLTKMHARHHREGAPLSVAIVDMDGLKAVNDTHGHQVGDQVLATVGQLLSRRLRPNDLRCRSGGDEFIVALENLDLAASQLLITRLLSELGELCFHSESSGTSFSVSFSAGLASAPLDGENVVALMARADKRMYHGKHVGGSTVISKI